MTTSLSACSTASRSRFAVARRIARPSRARAHASPIRMGPPLPSVELGRVLPGGESAKVTLGAWLDYACPFSAKAYKALVEQVGPHYGEDLKVVFYHQVQPWHPQSPILHEAAIAVHQLGGDAAFYKFSSALMEGQKDFFDANVWDKSRADLHKTLAALASSSAGVKEEDVLAKLARAVEEGALNTGNACTLELKFYVKLGRQTGIHVSPTTTLNGMVCDTSSSWDLDQWRAFLDPHVQAAKSAA